jgi:hypothetical protein
MRSSDWSRPRLHIATPPQNFRAHLKRFACSPHSRDLRAIGLGALLFVAAVFAAPVEACSTELKVALLAAALGVFGWAYQAANTRFGVADLFAAEIVTICRVAAVSDFIPRYVKLFGAHAKFPPYRTTQDYLLAFDNNAKDLEVLDGDVVRFVSQFYIYMKALLDSLERGADPEQAAWRETALNVIYSAFLAFESARQAITVLIDDPGERKEYVLTTLLSELPAYRLLLREVRDPNDLRKQRLESRQETYANLIRKINIDLGNDKIVSPAKEFAGLVTQLWGAIEAENSAVTVTPLPAQPLLQAAS